MRRGSGSQTDQGEVLDNCCHVTSTLGTLRSEGYVITIGFKEPSFLNFDTRLVFTKIGSSFTKLMIENYWLL